MFGVSILPEFDRAAPWVDNNATIDTEGSSVASDRIARLPDHQSGVVNGEADAWGHADYGTAPGGLQRDNERSADAVTGLLRRISRALLVRERHRPRQDQ
jgi:hypothetical protein